MHVPTLALGQRRHPIVTSHSIVTDGLANSAMTRWYSVGRSNHKNRSILYNFRWIVETSVFPSYLLQWNKQQNAKLIVKSKLYNFIQFITREQVTKLTTRSGQKLDIPLFKTPSGHRTFYYRTIGLWNNLDPFFKIRLFSSSF